MATNMGKKCRNDNGCGKVSYLQCVHIEDKNRKVSNCNDDNVNCGTNNNPTGVCYPLSVTPTVSAVNQEIKQIKDKKSGKAIDGNNEVATVMAYVGGIGVGVIVVGFICYKVYKTIQNNNKS